MPECIARSSSGRSALRRQPALFDLHGAEVAQRRMESRLVVEGDRVHDDMAGLFAGGESSTKDAGCLQPLPHALGGRVVPAVSRA